MQRASLRVNPIAVWALGLVLLAALGLRLYLLAGPQTELEADEAIVGLMARHILEGERPAFYYMQPYMGSLEAYLVAGAFALFGASTFTLKLIPLLFALLFVALVFATGYRIGGLGTAAISGTYVALAPAFLALWSLKARGGYVEVLVIGQLIILLALRAGNSGALAVWPGALLGFLAGLGVWTNPLVGVYLLPVALYLVLALRRRIVGPWILTATVAGLVGAWPLVDYNLHHGMATADAMLGGTGAMSETPTYLFRLFRYSLPILAGLAQASSSQLLFWPAFWASPAGWAPAAFLAGSASVLTMVLHGRWILGLFLGQPLGRDGRSLLGLLVLATVGAFVLSKFRELVTEPRYLLPLYSATPLLAAVLTWRRVRALAPALVAGLIALNGYSVAVLDPVLNLPDTAVGSRASNRSELADLLLSRGLDRVYTDYWIGYPLAFESGERIVPSVISGGFNRYIPYSHSVSTASNPAFVFMEGSREEADFEARLSEREVEARRDVVSVYVVYSDVTPLDRAKP